MAFRLNFDLAGNLEPVTLVLCYRSGERIGAINNANGFNVTGDMNNPSEISFAVNKKTTWIWKEISDLLVVWVVEWDKYYEISVSLDEDNSVIKNVNGMHLPEAELSQLNLYDVEIRTESDIDYGDGANTVLYNPDNADCSTLDRLLADKGMNFTIRHVDESLWNDARTYSFDDTSIYDAFAEIAEQVQCVFIYESYTNKDGTIARDIYVYDLLSYCKTKDAEGNICGYRGEFEDECPQCGGKNIEPCFGEDTTIFLSRANLVDSVYFTTDKDSVKNCFKLESGDDKFDDAIKLCNPSNSMYIWYISPEVRKKQMSPELAAGLDEYDVEFEDYQLNKEFTVDTSGYNNLVTRYSAGVWNLHDYDLAESPVIGYTNLTSFLYDVIGLESYLQTSMMPAPGMSSVPTAEDVLTALKSAVQSVAISGTTITDITATNAVRSMAEAMVDSRFNVNVVCTGLTETGNFDVNENPIKKWNGTFAVTSYTTPEDYPDEDKYLYESISEHTVLVDTDEEKYLKNLTEKIFGKADTEDYSVTGVFEKKLMSEGVVYEDSFEYALTQYSLDVLTNFQNCCQGVKDTLSSHGIGKKPENEEDENYDTYYNIYYPYHLKSQAINTEIINRESDIAVLSTLYDEILDVRDQVGSHLDMKTFLGETLWKELNSFRRESTYSNSNYISEGLSSEELFSSVKEFTQTANQELIRSATLQHSISSNIKNLFVMPEFAPLLKHFDLGNWIRIEVDEEVYKLRLLSYVINFEDFESSDVTFSDVTRSLGTTSDLQSVVSNMQKMSKSYSYVARQANQGNEAQNTVRNWLADGLNSALVNIKSNDKEEITFGNNGLLARSYNDITGKYDPRQLLVTHNILALTENDWESVSLGIGEHNYWYYGLDKKLVEAVGYGISAKFVTAGYINGSQIIGGEMYSQNYNPTTGTYINLNDGTFSFAGGKFTYLDNKLTVSGTIIADSGEIAGWDITSGGIMKETKYADNSSTTVYLLNGSNSSKDYLVVRVADSAGNLTWPFFVQADGTLSASKASVVGSITATTLTATQSGTIGCWKFNGDSMWDEANTAGVNKSGSGYAFWAGIGDRYNDYLPPFRVEHDGAIYADHANIKGSVTTSGQFGTSTMYEGGIYHESTTGGQTTIESGGITCSHEGIGFSQFSAGGFIVESNGYYCNSNSYEFFLSREGRSDPYLKVYNYNDVGVLELDGFAEITGNLTCQSEVYVAGKFNAYKAYQLGNPDAHSTVRLSDIAMTTDAGNFRPQTDGKASLGTTEVRWTTVWAKNPLNTTSDEREKDIIGLVSDDKRYEDLFMKLKPVRYTWNNDEDKETIHLGYGAQTTELSVLQSGLSLKEFAGVTHSYFDNPVSDGCTDRYGMNHQEVNVLTTMMTQNNTRNIELIKQENLKLKQRIDKLETLVNQLIAG